MANQVFQQLNGSQQPQMNQFNAFMQNPFGFLAQRKLNIPQQYQSNPHDAVNYLLNSGAMNRQGFNQVMGTLQKMGFKF